MMKIEIRDKDNLLTSLDVSKIVEIKVTKDKEFIYFDKIKDGTYRMTYTKRDK